MARLDKITDADLLDYMEGRFSHEDRAKIEELIRRDPALAARRARVSDHTLNVRMLRSILPVEGVPKEWLDLLARRGPR